MVKAVLLGMGVLLTTSAYAKYFPPADVQQLIEKSETLNDKCRGGSGNNPSTMKACDQRDKLLENIEKKGWCYGSYNRDDARYNYRWLPCKMDKTR
jgi:hypothetical protein